MRTQLPTRTRRNFAFIAATALVAALLNVTQAVVAQSAHAASPGAISLHVQSARSVNTGTGFVHEADPITTYKWMINKDDTGNPGTINNQGTQNCLPATAPNGSSDPNYADSCQWPSTRVTNGWADIEAQGDQSDLNDNTTLTLDPGKYLISVTADGFKIDGAHFTVDGGSQRVLVRMNPYPLPLSTYRISVFNDNAPVDATYELDGEPGLAGFTAHLTDVLGDVSTDYYGNPLCTTYVHSGGRMVFDANNRPVVSSTSTGRCVSNRNGEIVIPNLGPNRYAATVTPPVPASGQTWRWVQTTTLEGGHDHDIWEQEGSTGYDTEQTKGNEQVPAVQFGFVRTQDLRVPAVNPPTGEIKGVVVAELPYIGGSNGQQTSEGTAGAAIDGPIPNPWVALSDLDNGDQQIYVGRGNANGSFDIQHVPNGTYSLTMWDDAQDYIIYSVNVTVENGQTVDVGNEPLVGWFTHVYGKVFIDSNGNGKLDPGERGVPQFPLTVRERDNSLMDQAVNTASTDTSGTYDINETYPMGKWLVLEAFDTRYQTTGITYQAANDPRPTTKLGSAVDLNFLPIIGLKGEIDWGVQPYNGGTNGGIVGTVTYDTTRNELDPADAATEPYQPGIPDVPVHLYVPVACTADTPADQCSNGYQLDSDGSLLKGPEIQDSYTSEQWAPPRGCTARMYDGTPLTDQQALPEFGAAANRLCVESPMMGVAIGPSDDTPGAFSQTVNGNYGFATSKLNLYAPGSPKNPAPNHDLPLYANLADAGYPEQDLPAIDYIVSVEIPKDPIDHKPMYQVTKEEDVNVFDGDSFLPQENFPPTLAQANDPAGPPDAQPLPPQPPSQQAGIIPPCVGALHTVDVTDQPFIDGGGSPFQGQDRPLCTDKLVSVRSGQATAPNFNLFTAVPMPTHFWGLTLNDLGLTLDKRSVNYGEAQGLPYVPVGLYDYTGRLVDTTHTDFNGLYESLEPSTDTYNCPVPAGPCPNMYRFVGNDPGQPGALNADYNPRFRTIATNFQGWPGLYTVTDEAPTQVAATALAPDTTVANPTVCDLANNQPQLLAVDRPYVRKNTASDNRVVTISGYGFGGTAGTLRVGGQTVPTSSWSDTRIVFTVPQTLASGAATIAVTATNGLADVNGLTLQVLDAANSSTPGSRTTNPRLAEVGPGKQFSTIQAALEFARPTLAARYWLVVVWPNAQTSANPRGEYTENIIVHHQVRIQGVGPGGFLPDNSYVRGSIIDGADFSPDNATGTAWYNLLAQQTYSGNAEVPDSAVVTVLDDPRGTSVPNYLAIDGFTITGGSQSDFATNIVDITGGTKTPYGAAGALITQGGGIYLHNNVQGMQITDNIIRGNSGSYGGAIRVGTPYVGDNRNYNLYIGRNQIRDNGGTNLAGGIGLFTGSNGYRVDNNALCGNFSAEYGGALTAFGYQGRGSQQITHNRIWFNQSYDEGGGVMLAGELPANPNALSEGTGPATIDGNVIETNLANDDGGGIRLLQASGSHVSRANYEPIAITNNTIANNVSAHEGGGIALDDAAFVNITDDTIVKNLTTATAVTSNGTPAPAGLSTAANSDQLQAKLCSTNLLTGFAGSAILCATTFSKPTLLNDVFNDNRAGSFVGGWVYGIGGKLPDGTDNTTDNWDMGVADNSGALLTPRNSVLQTAQGTDGDSSVTLADDPKFVRTYDVSVNILSFRTYPAFRQAVIVAELLPITQMGDYHLAGTSSPARGRGAASLSVVWGTGTLGFRYTVSAASPDIDGNPRPTVVNRVARYDAGSDQQTS